jgi:hypothetical protein
MSYEYEPIETDGTLLKRIDSFLSTTEHSGILVSAGLPQAIPEQMVWLTFEDGSTINEGYIAILIRVKCLGASWKEAEHLALKVRSFIESDDFLVAPIYRVDSVSRPRRSEELSQRQKEIFLFNFTIYQLAINF